MGRLLLVGYFCIAVNANILFANSIRQQASSSTDNQGGTRQRLKLDSELKFNHSTSSISQSAFNLVGSREYYQRDDISEDEYSEKYLGEDYHVDSVTLVGSQTWRKLTDTRVLGSYTQDPAVKSKTWGLGVSHWLFSESLQMSLDFSRTVVSQPVFEYLDRDSDIISPQPIVTTTGWTLGAKHLATPTTILSYGLARLAASDRPVGFTYSTGVKQFIPASQSALHLDVARAINRGRVTTASSYGEVDAWIIEPAFLQRLWQGAMTRLGYRYYREDEVTRTGEYEYTRGSDLFSFGLAQELSKKEIDNLQFPIALEAVLSRYTTNELEDGSKLAANIVEIGVTAKF